MANLSKYIVSIQNHPFGVISLCSERTYAENPEEEACAIDRIASATAVRTLDFIRLKEGPPGTVYDMYYRDNR